MLSFLGIMAYNRGTMRILGLIAIVVLLLVGQSFFNHFQKANPKVITNTIHPSLSPTITPLAATQQPTKAEQQPLQNTSIPTNTPTSQPQNQNTSNTSWQYPNSQQTNSQGNTSTYQSADDPATIANWYKNKIQSLGMNTTSFIQNEVNGNISNELVGSNGSNSVRISIMRNTGQSTVTITVTTN